MLNLHLDKADDDAFVRALLKSHRIRLSIQILNSDEKPVGDVTDPGNMTLDGSVDVDVNEDGSVTRTLGLTLLDPEHRLPFTPLNPHHGATFADNLIYVEYVVEVAELDRWIGVPVFYGPLTSFEHDGETLQIEAQSKERYALDPHFVTQGYTLRKNTRVDDAMKRVLREIGERKFSIPKLSKKISQDIPVRPGEEPWGVIVGGTDKEGKKRVGLIDRTGGKAHHAFYDARGRFCVRRQRKQRVWTFGKTTLLTKPTLTWDLTESINYVKVNGGKAKGAKNAVSGEAELPPHHILSPESLSRNGVPRRMAMFIDSPNLTKKEECDSRAGDVLDAKSRAMLNASFEALVIPHLEPYDRIAVQTEEGRIEFTLQTFTIPLTSTEGMSVSFEKRIKQARFRASHEHGRNRSTRH